MKIRAGCGFCEFQYRVDEVNKMKTRNVILMLFVLLFAKSALAQEFSRVDVYGEYSYLRFNPGFSQLRNRSFNGGGGGLDINLTHMFAIKAEFMGYGSTTFTTTFT